MTNDSMRLWLTDCVEHVNPFRPDISYLFIERTASGLVATARPSDGAMQVRIYPKENHPDLTDVACLGALGYLRTILNTPAIKENGKVKVEYADTEGVRSLRTMAISGKRFHFKYNATNPSATQNHRIATDERTVKWAYEVDLTRENIDEFDTAMRVQAATEEKDDIFTLTYEDGAVKAIFGKRANKSTVELATSARGTDLSVPVHTYLSGSRFRSMLKGCPNGCLMQVAPFGAKVAAENAYSKYSMILAGKKPTAL